MVASEEIPWDIDEAAYAANATKRGYMFMELSLLTTLKKGTKSISVLHLLMPNIGEL